MFTPIGLLRGFFAISQCMTQPQRVQRTKRMLRFRPMYEDNAPRALRMRTRGAW
jgi:hypothetical protein